MTTEASTQAPPTRRRVPWFAGLTALLLAVLATLVLAGPGWLQHQLARQLSASLHREVTVERLELHPLSLSAVLHGLSVKNGHGGELAGFDRLELDVSGSSWSQRALVIERLRVQGLHLHVTHLGQGRYDVSDLLDAWTQGGSAGGGVPPFVLQQLDVTGRLVFDDRPVGRVHVLDDLHLVLPLLSSLPAQHQTPVQATLSAALDGAPLQLTAQTAPFADTHAGTLNLSLSHVDLAPLRAYLPPTLPVQPARGWLDAQLQLAFALPHHGAPAVSLNGQGRVADLRLDDARGQSLLALKSLTLAIDRADVMRRDIALRDVTLDGAQLQFGIDRDGHFHLGTSAQTTAPVAVAVTSVTAAPATRGAASALPQPSSTPSPSAASASPPWTLHIARVQVRQGVLDFHDDSVQPGFHARIDALAGEVTGLSTQADSVADLNLQGRYAQNAPVTIQARLNPLAVKKFLDLRAKVRNVELTRFSAYAGKYAGYAIEKGKFSLDAAYRLQDGRLQADNHVFIDQLTFGQRVESPSATSLPVSLAIALLKNSRGEIELDLPVSGSLDDPQFSIAGLLGKVIGNTLVKVVSAPFSFLSSLFGGGEELSTLRFAPGTATLDDAARQKLASLARAMQARNALTLEVRGVYDAVRDAVPLSPATARTTDGKAANAVAGTVTAVAAVGTRDLEALARQRAQVIVRALTAQYQVPPERVFELAPQARPEDVPVEVGAEFSLR